MTTERFDDDQVGQRLAQALETEANAIEVGDAWDAIGSRLLDSDWSGRSPEPGQRDPTAPPVAWAEWLPALVSRQRLWWPWFSAGAQRL